MKKHSPEQTFYWAKENGLPGYDHLDPKFKDNSAIAL